MVFIEPQKEGGAWRLQKTIHDQGEDMKGITATQLRLARLNGNKDFEGFDLCGMELIEAGWLAGCNLRWTDLSCADLRGARLNGADLTDANMNGADLRGARLVGAKLRWANLETADLRNADLEGADLFGADLSRALIAGANLVGVHHGLETRWPPGFEPTGDDAELLN